MRILLSGYYGFGNLGDEALLATIVAAARRRWPEIAIDVLSNDPASTAQTFGIEATPRADVRAVRASIGRADAVLSGGGGLFQNATSTRSLIYYAGIVRSAIRAGKKTMIFAQSIGPLDFVGRAIVRVACRGIDAATVRDERSRVLLAQLLPMVTVQRTADPVFLYDPRPSGDLAAQGLGDDGKPLVIVSVRESPNSSAVARTVATAIDLLAERYGVRAAFLPLGGAADADVATRVIRMARSSPVLLPEADLDAAASIIGRAWAVIGMRLHALILAARLGIPFLAIPYDPKVAALCEDLRYPLPPLVDPAMEAPNQAQIGATVDRLWSSGDEVAALLHAAVAEMRLRAEQNFEVLEGLLNA